MVQCGYFIVFILLEIVSCDLATEESKKSFAKSKKSFKLEANDNFHCDLSLLPQQKKMMYYGLADHQTERAFDIYKWPKNKAGLVVVPYKISRNSQYSE